LFFGYWKWLVNWETLGGYRAAKDISDFVDELKQWATGDVFHGIPRDGILSEDAFLDEFEAGMWEFLRMAPNVGVANERAVTVDEYASSPGNWARAGSSKRKDAVEYETEVGKRKKAKKSKWRAALAMTPGMVAAILRETRPNALKQQNSAIQKREAGKVRAVVNSDDETYLRMSYVSHWLEVALEGHPLSTLFMKTTQMVEMWERLSLNTEDETVKIPIDQSHFDWQQNKRMIARFVRVVRRMVETYAEPRVRHDLLHVLRGVEVGLVEVVGELTVGNGKEKITLPVEKGVMSGWRWTALMDTVMNWGELFAARKVVRDAGLSEPVIEAVAQGDDDQVRCPTYGHAAALAEAYSVMNFEVNPGKFFVDSNRDEFLRQVPQPGEVSGYGVRGVLSLLWRNPVSRDPIAGQLRMQEQVKAWNLMLGRGADVKACWKNMLVDVTQGNDISRKEAIAVLGTPAALGGIGFLESPDGWMEFKPGSATSKGRVIPETIRGLTGELKTWEEAGLTMTLDEAAQAMKDNLELTEAGKDVVPGDVTPIQTLRPYTWAATAAEGGVPLAARADPKLPITLASYAFKKAKEERRWDWIRDVWLDPHLRTVSDTILSRGRRRVWISWLEGKLPFNLPCTILE
jgi:hypothetical protein